MKHGLLKRSLSMLLVLVMLLGHLPVNVLATDGGEDTALCEHSYETAVTEATCTEEDKLVKTCTACGAIEEQTIPAAEHAWGDWTMTAEPTAEAEGEQTRVCGTCGAEEKQAVAKLVVPAEDPMVADVQQLIDSLPTEVNSLKLCYAVWDSLEILDKIFGSMTEAQRMKLDLRNYDAAINAAAKFYNPEGFAVWADTPAVVADSYGAGDQISVKGSNTQPDVVIPAGTYLSGPVQSAEVTCGKMEHPEHTDVCYDKELNCDHTHVKECYDSYSRCYDVTGMACGHAFHYWDGWKQYGSKTLVCDHQHIPYGEENSCYVLGDLSRTGCPTLGLLTNWEPYTHTHSEPACYTYVWTVVKNRYTITWKYRDAEGKETETTTNPEHGDVLAAPRVPDFYEIDGITCLFSGWDGLEEGATATEEKTYTAKYIPKVVYTVTFNSNGGSDVELQAIDVIDGVAVSAVAEPEAPTKAGFAFAGWYTDEDCAKAYTFGNLPTESFTLHAKWLEDINSNGVYDAKETITINVNKANDADAVSVTGLTETGEGKYVFDSMQEDKTVAVVAAPSMNGNFSATYVAAVEGAAGTGTYGTNYEYTFTFAAENGQEIVVNFAEAGFVYDEDGKMPFLPGLETAVEKDVYEAVITSPEYDDGTVEIKYLAREKGSYAVYIPVLLEDIPFIGDIGGKEIEIPLEERWVAVDETFDNVDVNVLVNEKVENLKKLIEEKSIPRH